MSDCYYENCGDCTVTPRLEGRTCEVTCDDEPGNYPCLPRCDRRVVSYSERPEPRTPPRTPSHHEQHRGHRNDRYDREPVGHQKDIYHHRCCPPPPSRQSEPEPCCKTNCKPVKTKYIIPCYRYEDGRIVQKLPVSAFKRNGMQDQEYSKLLGTANFLQRCPQDVSIECDVCVNDDSKLINPAVVLKYVRSALGCSYLKKQPIPVSLEDILD